MRARRERPNYLERTTGPKQDCDRYHDGDADDDGKASADRVVSLNFGLLKPVGVSKLSVKEGSSFSDACYTVRLRRSYET